jgi:hypothetical protein
MTNIAIRIVCFAVLHPWAKPFARPVAKWLELRVREWK